MLVLILIVGGLGGLVTLLPLLLVQWFVGARGSVDEVEESLSPWHLRAQHLSRIHHAGALAAVAPSWEKSA